MNGETEGYVFVRDIPLVLMLVLSDKYMVGSACCGVAVSLR